VVTDQTTLSRNELARIDAWWRAANYLSVGQIYLLDNPLLREPLRPEHVKPRLLGHWGTTPGLNFVYAHLNRAIVERDLDVLFVCGPGHGGPAMVANTWLEGSYTQRYPDITRDGRGMQRLFRQFSFPGGIPSHAAAETPGSIHEGGELGYSLAHAYGAAFDQPDLLVACVIGDGEAETGALATSWHANKLVNPTRDGAGAADPASQRLEDRQPDDPRSHLPRRAHLAARGLRLRAVVRRGRRARGHARADGGDARRDPRPHRHDPTLGARRGPALIR
jgi:xylulose-5-phosphate/fructose-6-phosphate phosphoketolase